MKVETNAKGLSAFCNQNYLLTAGQSEAIRKVEAFLKSGATCFLLKGYAGTGKSFLIRCISEYLTAEKYNNQLMAPTGRAARILSGITKQKATTIHKGIYDLRHLTEEYTLKGEKEKYKFIFGLRQDLVNVDNVFIVDEASMVDDNYSESDFIVFGSGRVLKDLLQLLAPSNEKRNIKLIFVGDDAQLPPVGSNISGALSVAYLLKEYQLTPDEITMTTVLRQSADSPVLDVATYIREQLVNKQRNSLKLPSPGDHVHHTSTTDAHCLFLEHYRSQGPDSVIMIHQKNADVYESNVHLRKSIFPGEKEACAGDRLIIVNNNYLNGVELLNGTFVTIAEVRSGRLTRSNIPAYTANGDEVRVSLSFRQVILKVADEEKEVEVICHILENLLYSGEPSLSYEQHIASYIDFKLRNPSLNRVVFHSKMHCHMTHFLML